MPNYDMTLVKRRLTYQEFAIIIKVHQLVRRHILLRTVSS